uniref:Peptidase aspartic putative domain-containing protein n=1 Tax=Anopheles funestus TaxID=62324 RepID=A0A182S0C7_ANOFN
MPKTRSDKGMEVAEAGPSKAPTTPSNETSEVEDAILDQTVAENTALKSVEEMSRLIAEEIARHNKEMYLRKQLLELKMKHQKELREMEQSYQQLDISFPVVETKQPVAKGLSVTPEQRLARKSVSTSLAKFSGKVEEWPLFISSFKDTTCGFSNLENLKRLQDCLTGDALEQVRGSLLTPETVPSVIEDLKNLFGRPQKLLKMMLKKVRETKPPTEDQVKTFIVFGMKVKQLNEHLVACEMTEHLGNPLLVDELVGKLPTSYKREWRYDHLADIPIIGSSQQTPMLVIGLNNIELFAALETRVGNPGEPVAVRFKIGWTIYGVADRVSIPHVVMNLHRITAMTNRELYDAVGSQYKLEQMSVPAFKMPIAGEEKRAKDILERTTRRVGNRFETGLLWREDNRSFPDSYPTAEKRMQQLARRLKRNPALESRVTEMIREYERKGYAHKVTEAELSGFSKEEVWYLPLNVVHNAKKPEKIRLVWDAASTVAGVSLNSMLIKGPD